MTVARLTQAIARYKSLKTKLNSCLDKSMLPTDTDLDGRLSSEWAELHTYRVTSHKTLRIKYGFILEDLAERSEDGEDILSIRHQLISDIRDVEERQAQDSS